MLTASLFRFSIGAGDEAGLASAIFPRVARVRVKARSCIVITKQEILIRSDGRIFRECIVVCPVRVVVCSDLVGYPTVDGEFSLLRTRNR